MMRTGASGSGRQVWSFSVRVAPWAPLLASLGLAGCAPAAPDDQLVVESAALRATARGLLRAVDGTPLAGARIDVSLPGGGGRVARETSAADGSFRLCARPGTYDLLVTPRSGFLPQPFPAQTIAAGETLQLVLAPVGAVEVRGRLRDGQGGALTGFSACWTGTCAITDEDGQFAVAADVRQPGSLTIVGGLGAGGGLNLTVPVDLAANPELDLVVPLVPVTGKLVDGSGAALAGVSVLEPHCRSLDGEGWTGQICLPPLVTDEAGRVRAVSVPGTTSLFVRAAPGALVTVELSAAAEASIALPASHRLSGRLADRDGAGRSGAKLCFYFDGCTSHICTIQCVTTDDDGRYQVDLSPADYRLYLSSGPADPLAFYSLSRLVPVSTTDQELDVTLPNRHLSGLMLDAAGVPAAGATIVAGCANVDFDGFTGSVCPSAQIADADGRFRIEVAAAATIDLSISEVPGQVSVDVSEDADVEVRLPPSLAATGRVVDAGGVGLSGRRVCYSSDPVFLCTVTDGAGAYQLALPPGVYGAFADLSGAGADYFSVTVTVSVPGPPATLQAPPIRTIAGQLLDQDGQPIAGAHVFSVCQDQVSGDVAEMVCGGGRLTDAAGRFSIASLAGPRAGFFLRPSADPAVSSFLVGDLATDAATSLVVAVQPLAPPRPVCDPEH